MQMASGPAALLKLLIDRLLVHFIKLPQNKTEIVHLSRQPLPIESIELLNQRVETKKEAKCLGVWWCHNLSSAKSIEENINKARRAFFALGAIDVVQGQQASSLEVLCRTTVPILCIAEQY